ncbi:hypothetical protein L1987_28159 [Smallanthus sonchifolius]|uniref:Uncharacterized protein n=1 Tax=Smallanthus sonchifolius TaxID=185202 RepID=A0ACB9ICA0_9ASTR|nr:hypothetical protein L1987_28159 [Smallanthus sonchifolius]
MFVSWHKLTLSTTSLPLPPGPYSLPIVGYLPFLGRDLHTKFTNMAHTYGPIFKFYLGSKLHVVINTPELAKVVVRDLDDTFANRDLTVAASVNPMEAKIWPFPRTMRRGVAYIAFLTEANVITRMVWDDTTYKGEQGIRVGAELQTVVSNVTKILEQPNLSDFFPTLAWFDLQGVERNMKKELKKSQGPNDATSLNIIQVKTLLSDFMLAGTHTTTTLIEWAMANIMRNHKETFRLNPVSPVLIPRVPSKDCVVDGYKIPKDCVVFLNVLSIHRNPRYWDNLLEFNPERFLANEGTNKWDYSRNNLKFVPFGSGRRLCPGIPLAEKMQMFILASLLHSFDWSLPEGEEHDLSESFGLTLKKSKPLIAVPYQRLPDKSLYM